MENEVQEIYIAGREELYVVIIELKNIGLNTSNNVMPSNQRNTHNLVLRDRHNEFKIRTPLTSYFSSPFIVHCEDTDICLINSFHLRDSVLLSSASSRLFFLYYHTTYKKIIQHFLFLSIVSIW